MLPRSPLGLSARIGEGYSTLADLLDRALLLFGFGSRAERVVLITAGLVLAPWGGLPWAIVALSATAWLTVVQRILHVQRQAAHR